VTWPLLQILFASARGRVVRWGRQLRQPKYLFGFLVGVAWLTLWLGSWTSSRQFRAFIFSDVQESMLQGELGAAIHLGAALATSILMLGSWLIPFGQLGLPLKEADLQLLLPAPISRRQIIQYALLKKQAPIVLTAVIFSIIMGSGGVGDQLRIFASLWILLTIFELHAKWHALVRLRLREIDQRAARVLRVAITLAVALYFLALASPIRELVLLVLDGPGADDWAGSLEALTAHIGTNTVPGLAGRLLAPFFWMTGPVFAGSAGAFALALPPAALVMILLHEAVVRSRARFEETALRQAQAAEANKRPGKRLDVFASRTRRLNPFSLPALGRPELAVLWKNLHQTTRFPLRWIVLGTGALLLVLGVVPALLSAPGGFFGFMVVVGAGFLGFGAIFGPMSYRGDLRMDLLHVDLLRTWPLLGQRLVLAEVLTCALWGFWVSTMGAGLMLAGLFGASIREALHSAASDIVLLPDAVADAFGLPLAVVLLLFLISVLVFNGGVAFMVASLMNIGALMFPAWAGLGHPKGFKGMAAMGQNMVFGMGLMLVLIISMIPGAVIVGVAVLVQWALGIRFDATPVPLWIILAALPLYVEALVAVRIGGQLWDRLDPTQEILETSRS